MLTAFYHPGYAAPIGEHIMPIRKFGLIAEGLAGLSDVRLVEPQPVSVSEILRVHSPEYVEAVRTGLPRALAESQKFPWSPELFPSVCLTNGGCVAAARQALTDGVSAALVSGFHHACADHGEGFCTFNGLAIAADALLAEGRARKIAVLDMDLHYGNGTAHLAAVRPHMFQVSIYGNDYWENVSYRDVTLRHHADGANHHSFALPNGCDRETMLATMARAFPLIAAWKPDVLLYQAGADPYFEDPFSPLSLDHADLLARDEAVFRFAKANSIPVAWVLAGGYTQDTSKVVRVHLNTFEAWRAVF